ncbi:MAG: hypothetical protein ACI312_01110 [Bacilli bacterium]
MEENNRGKGLFYGVIGVATLIVAIIGATFAWFTATANGNTNTVVKTGTLSIEYVSSGEGANDVVDASNLKPATTEQVLAAYKRGDCKFANEEAGATETICAFAKVNVKNTGSLYANIDAHFNITKNEYVDNKLMYSVFTIEPETLTGNAVGSTVALPSAQALAPQATSSFTVLLWLDENAVNSGDNDNSNKTFTASINVQAVQTNK